jgi:ribosomal-protein-alanine N-acetyltransferase
MAAGGVIRRATPNDLARVAEIERSAFSDPWSRRAFEDLVTKEGVVFLVVEDAATDGGGAVAGYAIAIYGADQGELANVAVADVYRRRGFGEALVRAVALALREAGVSDLWLEVRASNSAARGLYGHLGFVEAGLRKGYYDRPREDAVVMRALTELR